MVNKEGVRKERRRRERGTGQEQGKVRREMEEQTEIR